MARAKRIDQASESDWSFLDDPLVMEGLEQAAGKARNTYGESFEDCLQDALLWTSVRPEMVASWVERGDVRRVRADAYRGLSRAYGARSRKSPPTLSYEAVYREGEP